MNTRDIKLDSRFFCLFKGDPGSGKSIAAGSFPNPYFFDIDGRMKAVVNYWRPRGREFDYDHYTDFLKIKAKLDALRIHCPYKTLVFDGITAGGKMILNTMVETRDSKSKKILRGGIELNQIEDYGGESRGLDTIINDLKYLSFRWGVNVVVTAHVITTESKDIRNNQTTISRSLLTGGKKVAASLPIWFDEAYHFDVVTPLEMGALPRYTCITRNVGQDWAKTALPLPLRVDFTDGSLYDSMMESMKGYEFVEAQPMDEAEIAKATEGW